MDHHAHHSGDHPPPQVRGIRVPRQQGTGDLDDRYVGHHLEHRSQSGEGEPQVHRAACAADQIPHGPRGIRGNGVGNRRLR